MPKNAYGYPDKTVLFYAAAIGSEFFEDLKLSETLADETDWSERTGLAVEMAIALDRVAKSRHVKWRQHDGRKFIGNCDILRTIEIYTKMVLQRIQESLSLPDDLMLQDMAAASIYCYSE